MLNTKRRNFKRIGILFIVVGVLFLGFGSFLSIIDFNDEGIPYEDKKTIDSLEEDEYPPEIQKDIVTNDSKEVKKKHCLDNFCITYMNIKYMRGSYGAIYTELENIGTQTIPAGFLNMEFQTKSGIIVKFMYHPEILPGEKNKVGTNFLEEDIAYASDYQLTYPTDEQLVEYQKTLTS